MIMLHGIAFNRMVGVLIGFILLLLATCTPQSESPRAISLDGNWGFAYIDTFINDIPPFPEQEAFKCSIPVPAFWDDYSSNLKALHLGKDLEYFQGSDTVDFSTVKTERQGYRTKPLPYIEGVGYYHTSFRLPQHNDSQITFLDFEEVSQEAWVWLNGNYMGHQLGHALPFSFNISEHVKMDEANKLVVAVSNLNPYHGGFAFSGYKGRRGGLTGSVRLCHTDHAQIRDCYVYTNGNQDSLFWEVELEGPLPSDGQLKWQIQEVETGVTIMTGDISALNGSSCWTSLNPSLELWSDKTPHLYNLLLEVWDNAQLLDAHSQRFGLRRLVREGINLKLNDKPIYLRGVTDHCYWAETLTPPQDKVYYLRVIQNLQDIGFNWIRFHTWIPNQAYLEAADESGMLMMVEAPEGFGLDQWEQLFQLCRSHPSVVLYSGGNEQNLDEAKIESLSKIAQLQKEMVPDALFNPQEALRGIEYWWRLEDLGTDTTHTPFVHNYSRLNQLKTFSDVFGQYGWGYLSYWSEWGDPDFLDQRMGVYERPCLAHEVGIKGNYIDLTQMNRMRQSPIGADRYDSARKNLLEAGLLNRADKYYRNSVAWLHTFRKQAIETVRRSKYYRGYDFLGGHDHNQIGGGYEAGFLNAFFELKPGDKRDDFLRYNNASVLLLDVGPERIFMAGDSAVFALKFSHWDSKPIENGHLSWKLVNQNGFEYDSGELNQIQFPSGQLGLLDSLHLYLPAYADPDYLSLQVTLMDGANHWMNDWDFWVFPEVPTLPALPFEQEGVEVIRTLTDATFQQLIQGQTVVLLGTDIFPSHDLDYTIGLAGRTHGNLATVIENHPIMKNFPHQGWCSWQFRPMFSDTATIVFNETDIPFEPIIEIVSSYKYIIKQAVLFELQVGQGRLIVTSLHFQDEDPAGQYLLSNILKYAQNPDKHVSAAIVNPEVIQDFMVKAGGGAGLLKGLDIISGDENQRGNLDEIN